MRISDWSSDVCSSDLLAEDQIYWKVSGITDAVRWELGSIMMTWPWQVWIVTVSVPSSVSIRSISCSPIEQKRSEEHTSELQSLMRTTYAVFCLKKNKQQRNKAKKNSSAKNNTERETA